MNRFSIGLIVYTILIMLGSLTSADAVNRQLSDGFSQKRISAVPFDNSYSSTTFDKAQIGFYNLQKIRNDFSHRAFATVHNLKIVESDEPDNSASYDDQNLSPSTKTEELFESSDGNENTPVSAGDVLDIQIPGYEKLSRLYDVDPEGFVYVLNKTPVERLSESDVGQLLTRKLKKYLAKGDIVDVRLARRKRFILIKGGVLYPGWYRMPVITRLNAVLSAAGGVLKNVDMNQIRLIRFSEEPKLDPNAEIILEPNDTIEAPIPSDYQMRVDTGDLLFVTMPRQKEQARDKVVISYDAQKGENRIEVDRQGNISSPRFNLIHVDMKTTQEIEEEIAKRLPKYLKSDLGDSNVRVNIIEKRHFINVSGNVNQPGWHRAPESANIQEVLNKAGGPGAGAVMSNIRIRGDNGKLERKVNLHLFKITGDIRLLTPLHANDTIFVPIDPSFGNIQGVTMPPLHDEAKPESRKTVRIFGAVKTQGVFEPRNDEDIMSLLALAGGQNENADLSNIKLIRNNNATEINLNQLLSKLGEDGQTPLPEIRPGDLVIVPSLPTIDAIGQDAAPTVRIFGAVTRAGVFEAKENLNLMDLIMMAQWGSNNADLSNINIIRSKGQKIETFDLNRWLEAKKKNTAPPQLPLINAGDTVYVNFGSSRGEFSNNVIYVTGEVNSPGAFPLTPGLTVIQAVTLAGGLGEWADADEITIIRMENGRQRNLRYNYEAAVKGRYFNSSFQLRPNDTIVVP